MNETLHILCDVFFACKEILPKDFAHKDIA